MFDACRIFRRVATSTDYFVCPPLLHRRTEGGGGDGPSSPLPFGHFVKDFTKRVHFSQNSPPPPVSSMSTFSEHLFERMEMIILFRCAEIFVIKRLLHFVRPSLLALDLSRLPRMARMAMALYEVSNKFTFMEK